MATFTQQTTTTSLLLSLPNSVSSAFLESISPEMQLLTPLKMIKKNREKELKLMNRVGGMLMEQGRLEKAETLYRRALAGFEDLLDVDHPYTLTVAKNLGSLLQDQGKLEEAEPLYRRALAGCERVLGVDHPDTLSSVNSLALLLYSQGKLDEVEPLLQRAFEGFERVLGSDHEDTQNAAYGLKFVTSELRA